MVKDLTRNPWFFRIMSSPFCYPLRLVYPVAYVMVKDFKNLPKKQFLAYIGEYISHLLKLKRVAVLTDFKSLRRVMKERTSAPTTQSEESMAPVREGR